MIPEGWDKRTLEDVCRKKIVYGIVQAGEHDPDGIPYIKSSNVGNEINISSLAKTDITIHQRYKRSTVRPGDIVFSLRGNTGQSSIVPLDLPEANLTQGTARIAVESETDNQFLRYQLSSHSVRARIYALSKGSTFTEISLADLRKLEIPLPPLPEQRKIAEILSTWDRAIETTEKLMANARSQKRALMQILLTGKRRFSEFEGQPWREVLLRGIADVIVSNVDKKSKTDEIAVRLCNYTDVYKRDLIEPSQDFMAATATASQIEKFRLHQGDVVITKDSETADDIAMPSYVRESADDLVCGYHLAIIRPGPEADGRFLKYCFELPRVRHYFGTRANGAIRFGLTIDGISEACFEMPDIAEQRKISSAIAEAEEEIEMIQTLVSRLCSEKAALMQQMLTGKRRVKV